MLAAGFLSAVASRLGLWGKWSSGWVNFVRYTAEVNSFLPRAWAPVLAMGSTVLETGLGLLLLLGLRVRDAAWGAAGLTFLFGVAMAVSFGLKAPLDYSVFVCCSGAFLLATMTRGADSIYNFIAGSGRVRWEPLVEKGVSYNGVFVKSLRYDEATKRSKTILLKFEAGGSYPYHNHPGGEEIFVMEGKVVIEGAELAAGDYLYTPPGYRHAVQTDTGAVLMLVIPEEVEIL